VNHFAIHRPLDGRSDSYKGSANRILFQLPTRTRRLVRLRPAGVGGQLGEGAHKQSDNLPHEEGGDENYEQPENIPKH